jgi:serine phosphatase RsbU (regulator of sigma subunit)
MIGIIKNVKYTSIEFEFTPNDRLYIFTDGIFEEFNSSKEEFGEERLHSILEENRNISLNSIIQNALHQLDQFLETTEKQDDITILGIEYAESKP